MYHQSHPEGAEAARDFAQMDDDDDEVVDGEGPDLDLIQQFVRQSAMGSDANLGTIGQDSMDQKENFD